MEGIMTVGELRGELGEYDDDTPVMIAVLKEPSKMMLREKMGDDGQLELSWMDSPDVEVHPLEHGDILLQKGIIILAVELTEDEDATLTPS